MIISKLQYNNKMRLFLKIRIITLFVPIFLFNFISMCIVSNIFCIYVYYIIAYTIIAYKVYYNIVIFLDRQHHQLSIIIHHQPLYTVQSQITIMSNGKLNHTAMVIHTHIIFILNHSIL